MAGLTALDIIILFLLAAGAATGAWRGFVQEALSLAALIVALFALRLFHQPVSMWLTELIGTESGASVAAFILILGVIWGGGKFAAARAGAATRRSAIGGIDRLLGAGFGVVKALLICTTAFMALTLVYDVIDGEGDGVPDWVEQSRTYPLLRATSAALSDIVAERLNDSPGTPSSDTPRAEGATS
jgi:membrane protein required for colicin V production